MPDRERLWILLACLLLGLVPANRKGWGQPPRLPAEMSDDAELADVFFLDADRGWAVGDRGVVLHTETGGRHWQLQRTPVTARLESVWFLDGEQGWAVGGWVHPYTRTTSGIVLRTQDSGRTWTPVSGLTLPGLKTVRFVDAQRGWAVGTPSALYPAGVFRTEDGGRSWTTLPAGATGTWLAADFTDDRHGILVGCKGQLAMVAAPNVKRSKTPDLGLRPMRAVKMVDRARGWLVGDGGLVLQTTDAGLTWQMPSGALPDGAATLFDFRAVALQGDEIWIAGAPGSCILHSGDQGNSWELLRTDQRLPLRALTFVDSQRGWAVGALGTILATRDGGHTWRRQRSGGTRLAMLGIFGEPSRLTLELFALQCGNNGYLGFAEVLSRRDIELPAPERAPSEDQAIAAMTTVGASGADNAWRFPLRQSGLQLSAEDLVKTWDRINDGQAVDLMEELVVRKIRQWRPEVIVTSPASPSGAQPLAQLINQVVLSAAQHAGDATSYPDHTTIAGLEPWSVKKVFAADDRDGRATVRLTTAQLAARLGRSLADQASDGYAMVVEQQRPTPVTIGYQLLLDELPQSAGKADIFSGIFLQAGGEARRRLDPIVTSNLKALTRAAQKRRNVEQLLARTSEQTVSSASWLGQVRDLTNGMNKSSAGVVLYHLAQRYCDSGQFELAAQTLHQLIERYPDHPLSESGLVWLIQYYSSSEMAWQLRRTTRFQSQQVAATVSGAATVSSAAPADYQQPDREPATADSIRSRLAALGSTGTAGAGFDLAERAAKALAFAKLAQQHRPELFAEPRVQFPVSVAYRVKGLPRDAERFYHRLSALPFQSPWSACAQAELWLSHGRGKSPKKSYLCQLAKARPRLDGSLDDEVWKTAEPLEMTSAQHDDDSWPAAAMLAYDREFLFLAVSCRKVPGHPYTPSPGPRPRDPDLQDRDRVDLLIDLDRDYTSYYRLTVDERGWTGEACMGHACWNPTWYVAAASTSEDWTVEAAIPIRELAGNAPRARDVWSFGIHRIAPGVGIQGFTQPAAVKPLPQSFALLVFR